MSHNSILDPQIDDYQSRINEVHLKEQEYQKIHAGHDQMHFFMVLILIISVFGVQLGVLYWKKNHFKSYQLVSLTGLWIIPPIFFYFFTLERTFVNVWFIFSLMNSWVIYTASKTPLHHLTPRMVYKWFSVTHNVSYIVGILGYISMMVFIFFIPPPDSNQQNDALLSLPLLFLCYGLYFGVLSRDFAELCADNMASGLGYYIKDGLPAKQLQPDTCAICNWSLTSGFSTTDPEPTYTLNCDHQFHDKCIRGWLMVGKKDICPYCHEKVDTKKLSRNPWDTQQLLYLNLLDWIRYLVVWQPVILILVQGSYYIFGLK